MRGREFYQTCVKILATCANMDLVNPMLSGLKALTQILTLPISNPLICTSTEPVLLLDAESIRILEWEVGKSWRKRPCRIVSYDLLWSRLDMFEL